jgi:hypothetical protein
MTAIPLSGDTVYSYRDPASLPALREDELLVAGAPSGVLLEPPGWERRFLRFAPEFIDDPRRSGLFDHLGAAVYRSPPASVMAIGRAAVIGYRAVLWQDQFCNDQIYPDGGKSWIERLGSGQVFDNEETELRRCGETTQFNLVRDLGRVRHVDGTMAVLCATEPSNYGSFIFRTLPKLRSLARLGLHDLPVLVYAPQPAQRQLLALCGVPESRLIQHHPYLTTTADRAIVPTLRNPDALLDGESLALFGELRGRYGTPPGERRIYVSRLGHTQAGGSTRVMQNEGQLIAALAALGFDIVEPQRLTAQEQIHAFASAGLVVGPSGSGLFNVAFCHPGTKLIDIESEPHWIYAHAGLFASCGLRYGIFVGMVDTGDERPVHRRWTVDIPALLDRIQRFSRA